MSDNRFQTGWQRSQNHDILEPVLNEAMKTKKTEEWLEELEKVGIACGAVNTIDQVAADPQVRARGMFVEVHHPKAGSFKVVSTPIKLSRTPGKVERACPDLGEHTESCLKELLAMTSQEIDRLRESGII
jgi:crotonobetainyl-CoA:carnitine CoA-transferase CaiB-like acyl-CoA transferase